MPMVRGRHTSKRKTKLLKYLPRGAFQNPMFSPGRDKQQRLYPSSGFSGPIVSIIPDEARRRPRRGSSRADGDGDDDDVCRLGSTQEPSSPKVSCIGLINLRSKEKKNKMKAKKAHDKHHHQQQSLSHHLHHDKGDHHHDHKAKEEAKTKKKDSKIRKMFGFASRASKSETAYVRDGGGGSTKSEAAAPSLGQMRRFSSGRQSLANFDWTVQIAPVNDPEDRNCHSDEEFGGYSDEEEEEEVIIPFSAPILVGMKEPRRDVNLWQRRNTASPPPLKLKAIKVRGD